MPELAQKRKACASTGTKRGSLLRREDVLRFHKCKRKSMEAQHVAVMPSGPQDLSLEWRRCLVTTRLMTTRLIQEPSMKRQIVTKIVQSPQPKTRRKRKLSEPRGSPTWSCISARSFHAHVVLLIGDLFLRPSILRVPCLVW